MLDCIRCQSSQPRDPELSSSFSCSQETFPDRVESFLHKLAASSLFEYFILCKFDGSPLKYHTFYIKNRSVTLFSDKFSSGIYQFEIYAYLVILLCFDTSSDKYIKQKFKNQFRNSYFYIVFLIIS